MKAVIFAGGVGTRLWPLSRKKSPKQFEKIIGDKSTLQLAVERLLPEFKPEDLYVATGDNYVENIKKQLPYLPYTNIISEPAKRDVGPAVALAMAHLMKISPDEPVIILWSDHLVKDEEKFRRIIQFAGDTITKEPDKIVFIGHKPRFASENLGWIEFGKEISTHEGLHMHQFKAFKYRPDKDTAQKYFTDNHHSWNLGYFVTTPRYIYSEFEKHSPEIWKIAERIKNSIGKVGYHSKLREEYSKMPTINFDNAVIEKIDPNNAYVINDDIQWSDMGAWEALKDALQQSKEDNVTFGEVMLEDTTDSLVFNYDSHKLIVGIDLDDFLVVNTKDILLVTKKTSVPKVKKLVEKLEKGGKHDHLL